VEWTTTRRVAELLVLVASTRSSRDEAVYSARVMLTVSAVGGGGGGSGAGVTVMLALAADESYGLVAVMTAVIGVDVTTGPVVMANCTLVAPNGTATLEPPAATPKSLLVRDTICPFVRCTGPAIVRVAVAWVPS